MNKSKKNYIKIVMPVAKRRLNMLQNAV